MIIQPLMGLSFKFLFRQQVFEVLLAAQWIEVCNRDVCDVVTPDLVGSLNRHLPER